MLLIKEKLHLCMIFSVFALIALISWVVIFKYNYTFYPYNFNYLSKIFHKYYIKKYHAFVEISQNQLDKKCIVKLRMMQNKNLIKEKCFIDETITISTPNGDLYITFETLEAIRKKLLKVLKQQQPSENYVHLVEEVENSKPVILEGNAFIGDWNLIYRDNVLLLQRQQMPRATRMLFFEAPLEWRDGQWQVLSINVVRVRGF